MTIDSHGPSHWQLRDLLCVNPKVNHEILYPCDKLVRCLDLSTGKDSCIAEFDFEPRCIQSCQGVIAAGGVADPTPPARSQEGLFSIQNRITGEKLTHKLGDCINNSVVLYNEDTTSALKALVCNNDRSLYFLDIEGSRWDITESLQLTAPLNHAAISPDKKTVVACGDTSLLTVCNPQERGWQVSKSFDSGSDLGFSVAFHSSGMMFGAAFQDGMARLYDIRNLKTPLTKIKSARPNELMGAFRCLKFSNGPEDLMFLSEQMERVHIIDLRDFENRQVLTVPSSFSCSNYEEMVTTNEMEHGTADDSMIEDDEDNEDDDDDASDEYSSIGQPVRMGMLTAAAGTSSSTSSRLSGSYGTPPIPGIPGVYIPRPHRRRRSSSTHPTMTSPTIRSYQDVVSQHQHSQHSRLAAQQSEYGLSGISWTSFDGGTIAVGTGSGIGLWKIDSRSRRTFPSFTIR